MKDLIERNAAKYAYCKFFCHQGPFCPDSYCAEVNEAFDSVPSASNTGKWNRWYEVVETKESIEYIPHCKCSECGMEYEPYSPTMKFCSNCGAKNA